MKQTRGIRNRNPCNIRFSIFNKWKGQKGSDGDFCIFESYYYGYRAFLVIVRNYYMRYSIRTVQEFVSRYAPRSENDTSAYCSYVVNSLSKLGYGSAIDLTCVEWLVYFTEFVSTFESGYYFPDAIISAVLDVFPELNESKEVF